MAAERLRDLLLESGEDAYIEYTQHTGHARAIATGVPGEVSRLAVVGGDGTIGEVLSGLTRFDVPIAILPMGTANLLGSALGLGKKPKHTAHLLRKGAVRHFDLGSVGKHRFISVAGVGFDAHVARELGRCRKEAISKLSYFMPCFRTLRGYDPVPLTVQVDGRVITENAAWVLVCNIKEYAAYFQFTPDANPVDGLFDMFILNDHGRWSLVRSFYKALLHRRIQSPTASYPQGRNIKIWSAAGPVPFELDGDYVGEIPIEINLIPTAIPLLVP